VSRRDEIALHIEALRTSQDPDAARRAALRALCDVAGSDGGAWYDLGVVDGDPVPVRWLIHGVGEGFIRRQAEERIPSPIGDPRLAPREWQSKFVLLQSLVGAAEAVQSTRIYERCWAPEGIEDKLRMTVYHRGEHAGWIGVTRRRGEPPFRRADARRVARLAEPIADALVGARARERSRLPAAPADVVARPDGQLEYASAAIRSYVDDPRIAAELRGWVRSIDCGAPVGDLVVGHRVRWSRLEDRHGTHMRYLLHFDPVVPVRLHPAFTISRTARRMASLAVAGATVGEIAATFHVTATTVRTHLRQVYEHLDVATRVELARALQDLPEEP
jgi:DNA-binding CsgD family transcriptional regulator